MVSTHLWVALVGGAVVAGAAFVGILVTPRRLEPLYGLVGAVGFTSAVLAYSRIAEAVPTVQTIVATFALLLASLAGGYAIASALLDRFALPTTESVPSPDLTTPVRAGEALLIVMACAESAAYDPRVAAAELRNLADEGLIEPTLGLAPFLFTAQKARYRSIGGSSPQRAQLRATTEKLEAVVDDQNIGSVAWAVCSGKDSLAGRITQGVTAGFRAFAVVPLSIGDSAHAEHARRGVDALRLDNDTIEIEYAPALWGSDEIASAVADRILASASDPSTTGVALVGHGQPNDRSSRFPQFDEQESAFLNRVRMHLTEYGIPERNIRVCWAEWRTPDVTSTVRHLAALDCRSILVAPAVFPLDSMAVLLDLPYAARQARVDPAVPVITIPTWGSDDAVLRVLAEHAKVAAGEALSRRS